MSVAPEPQAAILVVDDNGARRISVAWALESLGHRIVQANSGEAALHEVMAATFAVILMDVQMPGLNGYETARLIRMRSECAHTPIIFITAHAADEAQIPTAYESGGADFIFGMIVPAVLRAKVSFFVDLFVKSCELERSLSEVTVLSARFRDSEVRSRSVLDHVADGIVTVTDEGVIESLNRAASELFGYTEGEAIGQPFFVMFDIVSHEAARRSFLDQQVRSCATEWLGRRKDGSTFPMEFDLTHVQLGARRIHIGCLRDISERQTYMDSLQYQALHDDLTDLPNRTLFGDRVNHAVRAAVRLAEPLALLVLDLDEFKTVNDTFGHQHGDVLLKLVAERLAGCLPDGDTVARLGGDEFAILPLGPTDLAGAASVAWKVQQTLEPPFLINDHAIDVRASIGIALVPEHGDNVDDLLRRADLAMYDAKRSGAGYAMFAAAQEEIPVRRLALLGNLRRCIEKNELVLHYQPKIDLATQQVIGVEALIRWNHPSGRMFMPDEFMPEVETSELMIPITAWVVDEALQTLGAWRREGYDLTMAVNLGARCLAPGTGLFEMVDDLKIRWGIPPGNLIYELTEGAFVDTAVPGLLERLQDMDERLSIDDFGTGYSSLAYLQRLPVAEIKADRSFVMGLTTSTGKEDTAIVRAIIDLAHNLGVRVVAEGVEDEDTMNLLIEYGCDEAQGYYFSRPLPPADLEQWLQTSPYGLVRSGSLNQVATGAAMSDA